MSGFSTPCSSRFMLPMRSMVLSKSKPWNMPWWKCSRSLTSRKISGWCTRRYSPTATRKPQVPETGSQTTSVGWGAGHLNHEPDDVARGAELAILSGAGDLAEHVFIDVALGVAVLHRHVLNQVHYSGQQRR